MADEITQTPVVAASRGLGPVQSPSAQQRDASRHGSAGGYSRQGKDTARLPGEDKQFDERVVFINRVARVVKGGRRFRFQALIIVGDHKGQVGVGVSKGADVTAAVAKAADVAKKQLIKLPIYKGTLVHEVEARVSGARILILPAAPGTGLIAGGVVRTVLEVAGYENALSKSFGSSNRLNVAYATLEALKRMEPTNKWVTRAKHGVSTQAAKKPITKKKKSFEKGIASEKK